LISAGAQVPLNGLDRTSLHPSRERRVDARDAVTVVPAREVIFAQARRL
jgi:hypothetical protein